VSGFLGAGNWKLTFSVRASAQRVRRQPPTEAIYNKEKQMRKMLMLLFVMMMFSFLAVPAFAQTGAAGSGGANWVAITSGFAIAIASGLAAQGQGRAASAACEALGRNPAARAGIQVALILGLAFIESLVLFTLVIIFVKVA
jgi:F-type H+-transporting ATPase subunit c